MTDATSEIKKAMALGTDQEQGAALRQVGSPWSREARLPRGRTALQFEMQSLAPQRGGVRSLLLAKAPGFVLAPAPSADSVTAGF